MVMVMPIDIEVSRMAIGFQKVSIISLPQCTNTTLHCVFCSVALVKTINFLLNILAIAVFVSNWV